MIEGLIFGTLAWLSLLLSWFHLPEMAKRFTKNHPLLTDIGGAALAFFLISSISKSLVAVIAATVTGLLITVTVMVGRQLDGNRRVHSSNS